MKAIVSVLLEFVCTLTLLVFVGHTIADYCDFIVEIYNKYEILAPDLQTVEGFNDKTITIKATIRT